MVEEVCVASVHHPTRISALFSFLLSLVPSLAPHESIGFAIVASTQVTQR